MRSHEPIMLFANKSPLGEFLECHVDTRSGLRGEAGYTLKHNMYGRGYQSSPPHAHTHQTFACLHYGVHNEPLKVRKQNRKTSRNLPQAKNQTSRAKEIRSGEKWKPQQVGLQKSHYLYGGDAPLGGVSHPFKGGWGGGVDRG